MPYTYRTIADVKRANKEIGHYWFTPETMRFWDSKIETGLIRGKYFVTSERTHDGQGRPYTLRQANPDGTIATVGGFQAHDTLSGAIAAAYDEAEQSKAAI